MGLGSTSLPELGTIDQIETYMYFNDLVCRVFISFPWIWESGKASIS